MASFEDTQKTSKEIQELLETLEKEFPRGVGDEKWYLLAVAALTGAGMPEISADVYTYLINQTQYSTAESRKGLIRRLREALIKLVAIVGVCRPLEAIFSIDAEQMEEDKDFSFSRENWKSGPENIARGAAWEQRIYQSNIDEYDNKLVAHKDFAWIGSEIVYGLLLSDHTILSDVDTELVVLTGIMIQNLKNETHWHLRGMRRLGVSLNDVEGIHKCIKLIAIFAGVKVNRVPRVSDIEHEV